MFFRTLVRSFVSSVVSFLLFSLLITNFSGFDTDKIFENTFKDIYNHANPESKQTVLTKLNGNCNALSHSSQPIENIEETMTQFMELCTDDAKRQQIENTCQNIDSLRDVVPEADFNQAKQSCDLISSGELDKQCALLKTQQSTNSQEPPKLDISVAKIQEVCTKYSTKEYTDSEFFSAMLVAVTPDKDTLLAQNQEQIPQAKILDTLEFVQSYTVPLLIVFLVILGLLYVHHGKEFIDKIGSIFINNAIMILLTFALLNVYIANTNPDTGFILDIIGNGQTVTIDEIKVQALKVLFPIILLGLFSQELLIVGIVLLSIGIALKYFFHKPKEVVNEEQESIEEKSESIEQEENRRI